MHAGMGCGSVTDPQSNFRINQRPGNQLAAGICRLRTGPSSPPAVRDLHIVDESGFCPICHVTYTFGSVDACPKDERRVPPMTDKHSEHEPLETAADVPNVDDPNGRTTGGEERKSRLQAANETKTCQEAGESTTKDTNHDDPKIILAHADTQPNATCAEKAAGSDSDDGLQPPVRDIQSSSTNVRDPLENDHSSGEILQVSKDNIAHDGITYADYIHHVKVTERMLKAQLAAVTDMSFAEYARQVSEVQPTTAMNLPLEPKPIAYTDSCDTSTASTSDIIPMTHTKQKTIPVLSPGQTKSNNVGGISAACPSNFPRTIVYPDRISDIESSTAKSQKSGASKSYTKSPAKQLTTSFDKHLSQLGIILTPTSSEPNSDQGRSAAPKPVGGHTQDSDIEIPQSNDKKAFYDSDGDIEPTQTRDKQAYHDSDEKTYSSMRVSASNKPSSRNNRSTRTVQSVKASKPQSSSRALRPEEEVVVEKGWGTWGRGGTSWK